METKTCTRCQTEKQITEFHKEKKGRFGVKSTCKQCHLEKKRNNPKEREYCKKSYQLYKEKKKAKSRKYKEKNRDKVSAYNKEYNKRPEVKNKRRIYNRRYENSRIFSDPVYRERRFLWKNICRALMVYGYSRNTKVYEALGADRDVVRKHLQEQFRDGMSWDNYGEWQIDHIIPLSSAETVERVVELNHYTNLQPLWAEENAKKSNKILSKDK